ncbi:MAG: undecaprenyl-diphosphate phosphatase [Magnetospirillum sp. WYHS-4]
MLLAAFLGLIEGLTEFLPVSSTGHLVLLIDLLGFPAPPGKTFEIVIQLGAIVAVCLLYRRRLWQAVAGLANDPRERAFVRNLLLAFLPAMAVGAIAYPLIKRLLGAPVVVAAALVLGGIAILAIERWMRVKPRYLAVDDFTAGLSLRIGLFQVISMVPGVSRSGATIMGALLSGVERKAAAEFSFFLAIPTMAGATAYSLYKNWAALDFGDVGVIGVGFAAALATALVVVKAALAFIGRHGFAPFAWYRIVVGGIMLAVLAAG